MPILRPFILPTAGTPQQAIASSRRRGPTMAQPNFYEQQNTKPGEEGQFESPPLSGDYIQQMLSKMNSRQAPPALEPGSRVRAAQRHDPSSFQNYYQQLSAITQVGQEQLATEMARGQARRQAALRNIAGQQPPQGNTGGSAGQGQFNGGGNVGGWISQAASILSQNGINLSNQDLQWISTMIQHESGGNPNAINNWDSNAAKGIPSKGLMQTIDPTFNSNKLPGYNNIYDPVHNIIAGVRYSLRRYGSIANVPGIRNLRNGGKYVGY